MADNTEEVGVKLSLKNRKAFTADAEKARRDIENISKAVKKANGESVSAALGFGRLRDSIGGVASKAASVATFGLAGLTAGLGAAATAAGLVGVKTAASFEQSEIAFGVLLKNQQRAKQMIGDLRNFAQESPFELKDVNLAAQRLLAMGFAADEVMPTMKALGNAAASGIMPLGQGMERLSYALGQLKQAGFVQGDELRQFEEAGVGVRQALHDAFGYSMKDLIAHPSDLAIPAEKAIPVIMKLINDRFGGMMDAQSKSWSGMWSRFKETAQNNLGDITRAVMDPFKPAFESLSNRADAIAKRATMRVQAWNADFKKQQAAGNGGVDGMVAALDNVSGSGGKLTGALTAAKGLFTDLNTIYTQSLKPALSDLSLLLPGFTTPLGLLRDVIRFAADHPTAGKVFFEGMAIAITAWKLAELIGGVATAYKNLATAIRAAGGAQAFLNAMMMANPIGILIFLSIAFVAALTILWRKFEGIRTPIALFALAFNPLIGALLLVLSHLEKIERAWDRIKSAFGFGDKKLPKNPLSGDADSGVGFRPPGLAAGGTVTSGGTTLVGERGPELLTLPRAAKVQPLGSDELTAVGGTNIYVSVSGSDLLHAQRVADATVAGLQDQLARA